MGCYNSLLSVPMGWTPLWIDVYCTSGHFDASTPFVFSVSLGLQMERRLCSHREDLGASVDLKCLEIGAFLFAKIRLFQEGKANSGSG